MNDRFGARTILKQYAGIPSDYDPKVSVETRCPVEGGRFVADTLTGEAPVVLVASSAQARSLAPTTDKGLFAIGPLIRYASPHLAADRLDAEKKRLGRCLAAFPGIGRPPSEAFFQRLRRYTGFDTILVCFPETAGSDPWVRWCDEAGYSWIFTGGPRDPGALNRLRTVLELADATVADGVGNITGYALACGKRHVIDAATVAAPTVAGAAPDARSPVVPADILRCFSRLEPRITPSQFEVVDRIWGLGDLKSRAALRQILKSAEFIHARGPGFLSAGGDLVARHAYACLGEYRCAEAVEMFAHALDHRPARHAYHFGQAIGFLGLNRANDAAAALTRYRAACPADAGARDAHSQLLQTHSRIIGPSDVVVASFPRSGSTWLRRLLSDVIVTEAGIPADAGPVVTENHVIPDIRRPDLGDTDSRVRLPYRLFKTHDPYSPTPKAVVYLFRKAPDALCSFYHYHRRFKGLIDKIPFDIDTFCIVHLSSWCDHLRSYLVAADLGPTPIRFVSYEALHAVPMETLMDVCRFLGLTADPAVCRDALSRQDFQAIHQQELRDGGIGTKYFVPFFRKGEVGSAAGELSAAVLDYLSHRAEPVYARAERWRARGEPSVWNEPANRPLADPRGGRRIPCGSRTAS